MRIPWGMIGVACVLLGTLSLVTHVGSGGGIILAGALFLIGLSGRRRT